MTRIFTKDGPMKRFPFIALHAHRRPVRQQGQLLAHGPARGGLGVAGATLRT